MQKLGLVLFSVAFFSSPAIADDCTHLWNHTVSINSPEPKTMFGDTFTVYSIIGYYHEPNLKLQFKGKFPKARFSSLESYYGKRKRSYDTLYDHEIRPESGSENPFLEGANMDLPNRSFFVEAVVDGDPSDALNRLRLSPETDVHSVFFRAYSPSKGFVPTPSDLPTIHAVDSISGKPRKCPQTLDTLFHTDGLALLLKFIRRKRRFSFNASRVVNGTNGAIRYGVGASKVRHGKVVVVRYRQASYFNTFPGVGVFEDSGQVRYSSLCTQNIKEDTTLACLPDYLTKIDKYGLATVVIAKNAEVKKAALARGYNYLEDRRKPRQKEVAFIYRLLNPKNPDIFELPGYLPHAVVCTTEDFLAHSCQ